MVQHFLELGSVRVRRDGQDIRRHRKQRRRIYRCRHHHQCGRQDSRGAEGERCNRMAVRRRRRDRKGARVRGRLLRRHRHSRRLQLRCAELRQGRSHESENQVLRQRKEERDRSEDHRQGKDGSAGAGERDIRRSKAIIFLHVILN